MSRIDDTLVITFPVTWVYTKIGDAARRWQHLVKDSKLNDRVNELEIVLFLDRPDTFDEGEINKYLSETREFKDHMAMICTSAKLHIAPFNIPAPQSP